VIRVYDATGNVIETHEHAGDFKERDSRALRIFGLLVAVHFDVALCRLTRVMRRMQMMPMGSMRMMRRQFVFASTVMLRRFAMMLRGMFMVFSGFRVMFFQLVRHRISFLLF
jgi:hypothetical protein